MATVSIFERMLGPLTDCFTPEVAQRIVDTGLDPDIQAQIDDFAAKANEGVLTEDEKAEYAAIAEYIDLVGIIKAKARSILRRDVS